MPKNSKTKRRKQLNSAKGSICTHKEELTWSTCRQMQTTSQITSLLRDRNKEEPLLTEVQKIRTKDLPLRHIIEHMVFRSEKETFQRFFSLSSDRNENNTSEITRKKVQITKNPIFFYQFEEIELLSSSLQNRCESPLL